MGTNDKIIYKALSYRIIGSLFSVYNKLHYGHREKIYQKALAEEFTNGQISFKKECYFPILYEGKILSRYFFDFFVENKIILELKVAQDFYQKDINQILSYLKTHKIRLGILAIFTKDGLKYKRIVN